MIVIKIYSFELTNEQLLELSKLISEHFGLRGFPLILAADELRGRQMELILTPHNMPLSP